jgi:hypothetical protein
LTGDSGWGRDHGNNRDNPALGRQDSAAKKPNHESSLSKRKSTDFLAPTAGEEIVHGCDRFICADGQVTNIFFNTDNFSKQCAQGAIANLLNMLKCSKEELELFWNLANSDEEVLEKQLCEQVSKKLLPMRP